MKSSQQALKSRGFITEEDILPIERLSEKELIELLSGPAPQKRTAAVKIIAAFKKENHIPLLCELLKTEKKLYTKIALAEALAGYGKAAVTFLTQLLGKIGNNQHKKPAAIDLNKPSFPLPRDIAARIIIRIGPEALDELEKTAYGNDRSQITEAIDAIGHIAYNYGDRRSENILFELLKKHDGDELIKWKIVRAFQAFSSNKVKIYLLNIMDETENEILISEAGRSLNVMEKLCNKAFTA